MRRVRVRAIRDRLRRRNPAAGGAQGPRGPASQPPAAPLEETHLGPVMDGAVARARGNARRAGDDADYDLLRDNFDHIHFLLQATRVIDQPEVDPIAVFLRNGARAKAAPEDNVSMAAYLHRHPERAESGHPYLAWLREGRAAGELADPALGLEAMADVLAIPATEVAGLLGDTRTGLTQRLRHGGLGEMMVKATEIEPLVGMVWPETVRPDIAPYGISDAPAIAALHDCQRQAGFSPARAVVMVNRPRWGGGRRAEGHLAHAFSSLVGVDDVVVVYTDFDGPTPRDRFPDGIREVQVADPVGRYGVSREDAQRVLVTLLRSFGADVVVNINSTLFYEALTTYGQTLAATERIFHVMFCNDQGPRGTWGGHPLKNFYRHVGTATGVITDSHYLRDWLIDHFALDSAHVDKLHVFSAPVDPTVPVAPDPAPLVGRRPQVFWAGRIDRQKKPELVFAIARAMPDVDVRMWGEGVAQQFDLDEMPDNVTMEGAYAGFEELDLGVADAWLYTSGWDGVPSQLLEVAMTGVPIVGSLVGGTGEVLAPEQSWPVADVEDAAGYVSALREVLADPAHARRRARGLRGRLLAERTEAGYVEHVAAVLLARDAIS